jgi:hypothetical protein
VSACITSRLQFPISNFLGFCFDFFVVVDVVAVVVVVDVVVVVGVVVKQSSVLSMLWKRACESQLDFSSNFRMFNLSKGEQHFNKLVLKNSSSEN